MTIAVKLTKKNQATIPQAIRKVLGLSEGDMIKFEVFNNQVIIKKTTPLDLEYTKALGNTLNEWSSAEDDEAYRDL